MKAWLLVKETEPDKLDVDEASRKLGLKGGLDHKGKEDGGDEGDNAFGVPVDSDEEADDDVLGAELLEF